MNNLFKNLAERFKAHSPERKATEAAVPKGPPPYIKSFVAKVPEGHKLALGDVVGDPFHIIVEAGVRWHPEWEEPRVTVNVWRILPKGDALGWSGKEALASFRTLLPADVVALAEFHGVKLSHLGDYGREAMDNAGVTPPKVQQTYSSFNTFRDLSARTGGKVCYR
jgi:hypothetical protein